jgi:hypothetical protein
MREMLDSSQLSGEVLTMPAAKGAKKSGAKPAAKKSAAKPAVKSKAASKKK